jgi:hypothetical protein
MGIFGNISGPQELHPVNPPLGIYSNFTAKQPTVLTLREHAFSFSGVCPTSPTVWSVLKNRANGQDDFTIKDNNGYPVIKCEGQAFSFRGRKGMSSRSSLTITTTSEEMLMSSHNRPEWPTPVPAYQQDVLLSTDIRGRRR